MPEAIGIRVRHFRHCPGAGVCLHQGTHEDLEPAHRQRGVLECMFCIECGTRIRHANPREDTVSIKGGSLDVAMDLTAAFHIWTSRKLPGVVIPEVTTQYSEEPP
jgi:hypothetical protein